MAQGLLLLSEAASGFEASVSRFVPSVMAAPLTTFSRTVLRAPGRHRFPGSAALALNRRGTDFYNFSANTRVSGGVSGRMSARTFASGTNEGQSESDRRHEESGEYDTQDKYKRVGNPIAWANPTGGGTVEDNSSNKWRYVYPLGVGTIVALCLWSRWKNMRAEKEEQMISAPEINMP